MDLSIIVCVYNTPKEYLTECLQSITRSTLSLGAEYEICIIDDGSSTDYTELLSRFGGRVKYKWIENGGMLRARDEGLALAEGRYVAFVDSDDTVSSNYHLPMLRRAIISGADVVVNDWAFRTDSSRYYLTRDTACGTDFSLSGRASLLAFTAGRGRDQSFTVLWNKVYKRELLLRASALLHERCGELWSFNYSEDALRNFFVFALADLVENLHTGYYFYRQHSAQSVNAIGERALADQIERMSYTLGAMLSYAEMLDDNTGLIDNISEWQRLMSRTHYSYARESGLASLYAKIQEGYGVKELRPSTLCDGEIYASVRPLPDNFTEIDGAIFTAVSEGTSLVGKPMRGGCAERLICGLNEAGLELRASSDERESVGVDGVASVRLPKERISLKGRILRTPLVYKVGMLLFPKGSRLRAFFKRRV